MTGIACASVSTRRGEQGSHICQFGTRSESARRSFDQVSVNIRSCDARPIARISADRLEPDWQQHTGAARQLGDGDAR
jgi:hypothetical protein